MYVRVNASTDLYAYEHPLETGIWTATGHHSVDYFEWWDYCLPDVCPSALQQRRSWERHRARSDRCAGGRVSSALSANNV